MSFSCRWPNMSQSKTGVIYSLSDRFQIREKGDDHIRPEHEKRRQVEKNGRAETSMQALLVGNPLL